MDGSGVGKKQQQTCGSQGEKRHIRLASNSHYFAVQALQRMDLQPSRNVAFIQTSCELRIIAALINGAIDGLSITTPADSRAVSQGFRYLLFGLIYKFIAAANIVTRNQPQATINLFSP